MDTPAPTPAVFRRELLLHHRDDSRIESAFRAGHTVRLVPGWHVPTDQWIDLTPWERTELTAAAVSLYRPSATFSGITALQLQGFPGRVRAPLLHLDQPGPGHLGRRTDTFAVKAAAAQVPRAPLRFVHHRREPWDGRSVRAGHFLTVPTEIAVVEAAIGEPLTVSLPAVDAVLRATPDPEGLRLALLQVADTWPVRTKGRWARRVIELGDPLSESPAESRCRAVFLRLGLERPRLQAEFSDAQGAMRIDFFWPSVGVGCEYDGRAKWTELNVATGRAQWDRIHQHNARHDRLLAQPRGHRLIHLTAEDLASTDRVRDLLVNAGVPRDPRWVLEAPLRIAA